MAHNSYQYPPGIAAQSISGSHYPVSIPPIPSSSYTVATRPRREHGDDEALNPERTMTSRHRRSRRRRRANPEAPAVPYERYESRVEREQLAQDIANVERMIQAEEAAQPAVREV